MRVIAGSLKGRRFDGPRWPGLRPSSDRLRETLFNVLGDHVRDATVLDACAGTGALGIEAISRGAGSVVFVERHRRAADLIHDNLTRCGVAARGQVVRAELTVALRRRDLPATFDVVLVDPPYDSPTIDAILSALGARLAVDGVLVCERSRRASPAVVGSLTHVRRVTSGDSALDWYRTREASPETAT